MNQSSNDEIERLLAEHGPRRPARFSALTPLTDLIRGLRERGGSFETIQAILRSRKVEVSRTTIRKFCREVLGEIPAPSTKATRRSQPKAGCSPPQRATPEISESAQAQAFPSAPKGPVHPASTSPPPPRGPRVARVRDAFVITPNNATGHLGWMTVENDPL
jgi:hypothetical protein